MNNPSCIAFLIHYERHYCGIVKNECAMVEYLHVRCACKYQLQIMFDKTCLEVANNKNVAANMSYQGM